MNISVILKTTQHLGDHDREVSHAIDIGEDYTIRDAVIKCLKNEYTLAYEYSDHIEIRICK